MGLFLFHWAKTDCGLKPRGSQLRFYCRDGASDFAFLPHRIIDTKINIDNPMLIFVSMILCGKEAHKKLSDYYPNKILPATLSLDQIRFFLPTPVR